MELVSILDMLRVCGLFVLLIAAAYTDLVWGRVYNWCTYSGIVVGLLVAIAAGEIHPRVPSLGQSVAGLGLGFGLFYVAYLFKGLGLGDVKLMSAIGALTGWRFVISAAFWSALTGALVSIAVLIYRERLGEGLRYAARILVSPKTMAKEEHVDGTPAITGITIPFGFATALGTTFAWIMIYVKWQN